MLLGSVRIFYPDLYAINNSIWMGLEMFAASSVNMQSFIPECSPRNHAYWVCWDRGNSFRQHSMIPENMVRLVQVLFNFSFKIVHERYVRG